jgi:hypothetical protein
MLTDWMKNIVIGTVLGGSSLTKPPKGVNYYLSMRSKNYTWLSYKMQELNGYFTQIIQDNKTYRCNSCCSVDFTQIHSLMYLSKDRIITETVLHPLKDIGLAIWYVDGGGRTGRNKKNIYLNTTKFKSNDITVFNYFSEMGFSCALGSNRLLFSVESSIKFMKIIAHRIPSFMLI